MIDDTEEFDRRVVGRIQRQGVLRGPQPPKLTAIMTEAALRNLIGGREVMRHQLRYLVEAAERDHITLRVVPTAIGGHPGLAGPFHRMQFADRPSVVFVGNRTCSLFLEEHAEVAAYDRVIVELMSVAASQANSVRLVEELAATLE